ncbi:protein of unknown function (plasmid) [Cupriavidus taiwanensis]|uniref:Uncharacterized protein n=1 Tax=Cupriavidus taiwanensis TaxID=164546 RepID=A0A375ECY2_9BURK|nr:protein of unknown function [Cupriavidus taiwanensis]SOZ72384.1 protein of unknown function [Cupriavidus taiwanensis]SOZ74722.1 protein of unknown function [Cupriavidus taiwanensis]
MSTGKHPQCALAHVTSGYGVTICMQGGNRARTAIFSDAIEAARRHSHYDFEL